MVSPTWMVSLLLVWMVMVPASCWVVISMKFCLALSSMRTFLFSLSRRTVWAWPAVWMVILSFRPSSLVLLSSKRMVLPCLVTMRLYWLFWSTEPVRKGLLSLGTQPMM